MNLYYFVLYFFIYGFFGWCTEVAYASVKQKKFINRGFLNGPICPIYGVGVGLVVQLLMPVKDNLIVLYVMAALLVTVIEGLTGFFMDKIFHHKWWDYSRQPLNIGGYVCLIFSMIWGVACVLIVRVIHPIVQLALSWLPLAVGILLIIVLGIVLAADMYVTASGILKLNKHLEAMDKIALELKELSDKVGANIFENVMETMDKQEELKHKYQEMTHQTAKVTERLMKAFPKMESRKHKDILEQIKKAVKDKNFF